MKNVWKILEYPFTRLILWGFLKALIIAPIASFLFSTFLVYKFYGPTFDLKYRLFGTALEFFGVTLRSTFISSIPVSLFTGIWLAFFLRDDAIKSVSQLKGHLLPGRCLGEL